MLSLSLPLKDYEKLLLKIIKTPLTGILLSLLENSRFLINTYLFHQISEQKPHIYMFLLLVYLQHGVLRITKKSSIFVLL